MFSRLPQFRNNNVMTKLKLISNINIYRRNQRTDKNS